MNPLVSIIIPLVKFNDYIREAVLHYEKLDYRPFEIIILPDGEETEVLSKSLPIKVIVSGKVGPAEKRDLGAKFAKGEILAFTDDDAYPDPQWIKNALALFLDPGVGAVGGPAVTPLDEPFWPRVSGDVYASVLTSGSYRKRYISTGKVHEDYDLPSVNLIVRKEIFEKVGGFDSTFYPGEDTKLCLEIKKLGYKILYHPKALVYHHRRKLFPNHFNQIANYAMHRGFFAKVYPETSLKIAYFIPTFFFAGLVFGPLVCVFLPVLWPVYGGVIALYFLIDILLSLKPNPPEVLWTVLGVFLSHLCYGVNFFKGLVFVKELKR